jgi:tetratricopeptide (TPR) repeat protein
VRIRSALALAALAAVGCATRPLDAREWLLVATPHFEVVSSLGRDDTLELARDAERFHQAVEFVLGLPLAPPAVPTRIYAFDDRTPGRPFAIRSEAGYLLPRLRETLIVLRTGDGWREDATEELRHEYVHHLLRGQPGGPLPLWFDEGAAGFLSTVAIRDDRIELGKFRADHVRALGGQTWVPLARLLEASDLETWGDRKGFFPAQAWLFIHYLNFGMPGSEGRTALATYLERSAAGAPPAEAVRRAFGVGIEQLDAEVQDYAGRERFDAAVVRAAPFAPGEIRVLGEAEVRTRLGGLSLALRKPEQAKRWFEKAVAANRLDARAHAGLGVAVGQVGGGPEAVEHLDVALGIAQDDPLNHLDAAVYYLGRALEARGPRSELAEGVRRHAARSAELAPSPEAYALYGASYLIPGEDPAAGLAALEHAQRLLPASQEVDLLLARAHARLGHSAQARERVIGILARTHSARVRAEAEQVLAVVDSTVARRQILKGPGSEAPARE